MSAAVWAVVAAVAVAVSLWWASPVRHVSSVQRPASTLPRWWVGSGEVGATMRLAAAVVAGLVTATMVPGRSGVVAALVVAAISAVAVGHVRTGADRRRLDRLAHELPVAVDLLAAVIAAGAPPRVALAEVAQVSPPDTREVMSSVVAQIEVGVAEETAWRDLAARHEWAGAWSWVARDLARSSATGSSVGEVLLTHAREARRRAQELLEKRAKTAGVRSVLPLMVCFLPAFIAVGVVPIIAGLLFNTVGW